MKKNALLLSMLLLTVALILPYSVPNVSSQPEPGSGLPVDPSFHHFDLIDPYRIEEPYLGSQWHGLYPNCVQCREYELSDHKDSNNNDEIDVCDGILLVDKEDGQKHWYHVEYITVTMNVTLKPALTEWMCIEINATKEEFLAYWQFNPVGTQWHEVKHEFSNWYTLTLWFDNGNGFLDASDQILLQLKDPVTHEPIGPELEYHVEWVTTNIVLRPSEPWWFLPGSWPFKTGLGSNRNMTVYTYPTDGTIIPSSSKIISEDNMTFDMHASAPDASGVSTITVPQASIWVEDFFIKTIVSIVNVSLWARVFAVGDGSGYLATEDGALDVDIITTVTGDGAGGFTLDYDIGDGTPDPQGSMWTLLPLNMTVWAGTSKTDPTPHPEITITGMYPLPLYITTGNSYVSIDDTAGPYPAGSASMDGYSISGTGVPADPYTAIFTGVGTSGGLDFFGTVYYLGIKLTDIWSDFIFREILVGTPDPPLPPEPIQKIVKTPTVVYPVGGLVNCSAWIYNGLAAYTASGNGTTYAKNLKTGVELNISIIPSTVLPGETQVIWFLWNVTDVESGIYKLRLEIFGTVPMPDKGKTYTFHDEYIDCTVTVVLRGDFDLDLDVDLSDLYIFAGSYPTSPSADPRCDFDGNGDCDLSDLYVFAGNYLTSL